MRVTPARAKSYTSEKHKADGGSYFAVYHVKYHPPHYSEIKIFFAPT